MSAIRFAILFAALLSPAVAVAAPNTCTAPDQPVKGTVMGHAYVAGPADIYATSPWLGHYAVHFLTFTSAGGDERLQVQVLTKMKEQVDGKTFRRIAGIDHDKQPALGEGATEIQDWVIVMRKAGVETGELREDATVTVTFGAAKNGSVPGTLAICTRSNNATISGRFTAKLAK